MRHDFKNARTTILSGIGVGRCSLTGAAAGPRDAAHTRPSSEAHRTLAARAMSYAEVKALKTSDIVVRNAACPPPRAEDLVEYDKVIRTAGQLTFRADKDAKLAAHVLRVDADGVPALSVLLHYDRSRPGKKLRDAPPYSAYAADVVLGDGRDGRVVQTVWSAGSPEGTFDKIEARTMDRGDALPLAFEQPTAASQEDAVVVQRADGGVRLAATADLNKKGLVASCCALPATRYYELQDASHAPLGAARYEVPARTCLRQLSLPGGMDGMRIDLGAAPLRARRDLVAAVVAHYAYAATFPGSTSRVLSEPQ